MTVIDARVLSKAAKAWRSTASRGTFGMVLESSIVHLALKNPPSALPALNGLMEKPAGKMS